MTQTKTKKILPRGMDLSFEWVSRELGPEFDEWRTLAAEWITTQPLGLADRLTALRCFFEKYLHGLKLPLKPELMMRRGASWPDVYETALPHSHGGIKWNNKIRLFLNWVLETQFAEPDDHGKPVIDPNYWNPVPHRAQTGIVKLTESVHSPLPYRYILELRDILGRGTSFREWQWAHTSSQGKNGVRNDWYVITEDQIDPDDPDCVWRYRTIQGKGEILEMWSPVRAVALLVKLMLPLRTYQVRMLDSGESDTWRYTGDGWKLNDSRLARGSEKKPVQHGVFRRATDMDSGEIRTSLYINTNKTADIAKQAEETGYVIPWQYTELLFWLEKLRNWQEKYNPLTQPMSWRELDQRHLRAPKSEYQLSKMPDTCFLFRDAAGKGAERHKPVIDDSLYSFWYRLLNELERRCAARGETVAEGNAVRFVVPGKRRTTLYPLHSLRVSLLTCLAVDADVPLVILSKLVAGHSRLVMTLYYTKVGVRQMTQVLNSANERLSDTAESGFKRFLAEAEYEELTRGIVINSLDGLRAALPIQPGDRNPAGWMARSYGLCLVGGNTSPEETNAKVGGCFNGGELLRSNTKDVSNNIYAIVPGGAGNCVRCRWLITEPRYIDSLRAHFNNLSYHLAEAAKVAKGFEEKLEALKAKRYQAEQADVPFIEQAEFLRVERLWETAITKTDQLANDLTATFRLIKRCFELIERSAKEGSDKQQLVAVGGLQDLKMAFEDTQSELLQLSGICHDAELYPDENPGEAIVRRSQFLDSALYREGVQPVFMLLSKEEQLRVGNRFMDHLAVLAYPEDPALGLRQVIGVMESGHSLVELGLQEDVSSLLEAELNRPLARVSDLAVRPQSLLGVSA